MKKNRSVVILTANELRHNFFYQTLVNDKRFKVIKCFAEDSSQSLEARTFSKNDFSAVEKNHVLDRKKSEINFFSRHINEISFKDNVFKIIPSGSINDISIVNEIISLNPDIIACYGSSIIKSELLQVFKNKFLNVHLGLSPYYRGSGTNVWPLINNEIEMVGLTFMYIDQGVDTGKIIHQKRAEIHQGDDPHMIGNRLIKDMARMYADILAHFEMMSGVDQIPLEKSYLYLKKDFDQEACAQLYENFSNGIVEKYLSGYNDVYFKPIVENEFLKDL